MKAGLANSRRVDSRSPRPQNFANGHLSEPDFAERQVLQPGAAQAGVKLDIFCNHHVICYCAMIASAAAVAPVEPQDAGCAACIAATMPETAKALAALINEFGSSDKKALAMLKALHTISTTLT